MAIRSALPAWPRLVHCRVARLLRIQGGAGHAARRVALVVTELAAGTPARRAYAGDNGGLGEFGQPGPRPGEQGPEIVYRSAGTARLAGLVGDHPLVQLDFAAGEAELKLAGPGAAQAVPAAPFAEQHSRRGDQRGMLQ